MPFVVPQLFSQNELISATKYNTIRDSLIDVRDNLRAFEFQLSQTPQIYPFRLRYGAANSFVLCERIETSDVKICANVNAYVSPGRRVVIWGSLYNITTGNNLYTTTFAWATTRPNSGNNDVTLYNVSGVTIVFRVAFTGEIGFFRTGSSNIFGFSGMFFGGM